MTVGIYLVSDLGKRKAGIELSNRQRARLKKIRDAGLEVHEDTRSGQEPAVCLYSPEYHQDLVMVRFSGFPALGEAIVSVIEQGESIVTA